MAAGANLETAPHTFDSCAPGLKNSKITRIWLTSRIEFHNLGLSPARFLDGGTPSVN
jgi:hypothetical protein